MAVVPAVRLQAELPVQEDDCVPGLQEVLGAGGTAGSGREVVNETDGLLLERDLFSELAELVCWTHVAGRMKYGRTGSMYESVRAGGVKDTHRWSRQMLPALHVYQMRHVVTQRSEREPRADRAPSGVGWKQSTGPLPEPPGPRSSE